MQKYINLNAQYGFGQDVKYQYDSVEQIMQNMDRLGIWQTVIEFPGVANTLARAERLLKDIQRIPNWKERIIPSFVTDTAMLFETGALEKFKAILRENQPCCITLRPKGSSFRLRMADMVLDEIKDLCSVVLIDFKQLEGVVAGDDLVYLAGRYPQMSFVIRHVMWGGYNFMIDVMHRAKNICMDNSWLHTRAALEMFTGRFGDDRILFSTECPADGGAAMAAITFAELSEEVKDQIRFGNFVRLFRKEADRKTLIANSKVIPNQVPNRFWTPFVEQGIAPDVDIYDVHCHMGTTGGGWNLMDACMPEQVKAFEKDIEKLGLKMVVTSVSGRPDLIQANLDMKEAAGGREKFKGYLRFNPNFADEFTDEYLDACFATGYFVGLKTLPSYMKTDIRSSKYDRMFAYADKHNLPVLIHCWKDKDGFGSPLSCAEAATKWPNAKVVLGHSGGNTAGRLDCEKIAQDPRYNNVYFEFCGSFCSDRLWEDSLKYTDYRRVLYGTDACLHSMFYEMGKLLSSGIPDDQLTAILGANAKELYGF